MKNRLMMILTIIVTVFTFTGCGDKTIDIAIETVRAAVDAVAPAEALPVMMEIDTAALKTYYGLGSDEVAAFSGQMPLLNVTAPEILIVHAQKNREEAVHQALSARLDTLMEQWSGGDATQFALENDCRIVQNGDWLLLVIAESAEEIMNVFSACINSYKN